MIGTALGGIPIEAQAQRAAARQTPAPQLTAVPPADAPATPAGALPGSGTIRSLTVSGAQRLEPDTVRSYIKLRAGEPYTRESLDQALKDLYATELFADVQIRGADTGELVVQVRENPVINRIVLEGNKRIKEDKIRPEIKMQPRQIFTRSKARADVARIIQLYQRQGRYAATVEPKMVQLDQNRVDIVFEISEGAKSRVRRINIIGNEQFSDGRLRGEMATKQAGITKIFSSGTSYDPDRLSYDQQKLRQFYLTQGYADFRVVSAIAELTPDKRDFIITYVVEEGPRYKFGTIDVDSDIRDLKPEAIRYLIRMKPGDWYNAKAVEDTVDSINETAGLLGYAFADVRPNFDRDKDKLTMSITYKVAETPRVYVERVDINGNTITRDKVVRREMRLSEGDAFNGFRVKRSRDRIQSLGYFQDKLEIEQKQGSSPDKVILETNVEERSTGELQVSAGFSSLERFIVNLSITQRNFMGKGQELRASADYSTYSKSVSVGFTEPYLFDRNIAVGGDIFRRDFNSFNFTNQGRNTTYEQTTTGFQLRAGVPLTEFVSLALRYGLSYDEVSLDRNSFFIDGQCSPILAGRYLCEQIGNRLTSSVGYSLSFDNLNNRIRPTAGHRLLFSQDVAGLGGDVRYIRTTANARKYWGLGSGFVFSAGAEGGYIRGLGQQVRLIDRFQLGQPQIRGFDIRGVGPRVIRRSYDTTTIPATVVTGDNTFTDDALGGNAYYLGKLELELPLGNGARELGLRPSIFLDAGAVFNVRRPVLTDSCAAANGAGVQCPGEVIQNRDINGNLLYIQADGTTVGTTVTANPSLSSLGAFREEFFGDTPKPRLSVGFGVNWNSPFGPLRIDIAKALLKQPGDDTRLFTFNVGTQF
ncbi:MAG: outer membrane protein assembly factor BamA [Sphingomonas fennica]